MESPVRLIINPAAAVPSTFPTPPTMTTRKDVNKPQVMGVRIKGIEERHSHPSGAARTDSKAEGDQADTVQVHSIELGRVGLLPGRPDRFRIGLFQEKMNDKHPDNGHQEPCQAGILEIKRPEDQHLARIGGWS